MTQHSKGKGWQATPLNSLKDSVVLASFQSLIWVYSESLIIFFRESTLDHHTAKF